MLFERLPHLVNFAQMERNANPSEYDLLIFIPSPTGDERRTVVVWMNEGFEESVAFCGWHDHAFEDGEEEIIDTVEAILADQAVVVSYSDGKFAGWLTLIDLTQDDILLDILTQKYAAEAIHVQTWSGKGDRVVTLDQLELE